MMHAEKCSSVTDVNVGLTVCVAEMNCHPSQASGRTSGHLKLSIFQRTAAKPAAIRGSMNQEPHFNCHDPKMAACAVSGAWTGLSKMTRRPTLQLQDTKK